MSFSLSIICFWHFAFLCQPKKVLSVHWVYVVVCLNMYTFVFVQESIFACAQRSGCTSVCVSMHNPTG